METSKHRPGFVCFDSNMLSGRRTNQRNVNTKHIAGFVLAEEVKATGHVQSWENLVNITKYTPVLSPKLCQPHKTVRIAESC